MSPFKVLLVGHTDTVFKTLTPEVRNYPRSGRLLGPGVIDMKGGLVVMLEALSALARERRKGIRVLINDDEEVGSPHSGTKLLELARSIPSVLVFEPGLEKGEVVTSEAGVSWLDLEVKGRASHAGLAPEKGINACEILAKLSLKILALQKPSEKLTINLGVLEGGTVPNVVCETAKARFDIRFVEASQLAQVKTLIQGYLKEVAGTRENGLPHLSALEVAGVPSLSPRSSRKLLAEAKLGAEKLGMPRLEGRHVGYASDGNRLASLPGTQVLAGLGPYGGQMHTDQEFLFIESLESRAKLSAHLITRLMGSEAQ